MNRTFYTILVILTFTVLFFSFHTFYYSNNTINTNHLNHLRPLLRSLSSVRISSLKSVKPSKSNKTTVTKRRKVILFTTKWWQSEFPYLKEANAFCPKCFFTQNASMWNRSDGIIFHGMMLNERVPERTNNSGQIWILMHFETHMHEPRNSLIYDRMKLYDGLFNWTMTYRRDSDIFVPYGRFIAIKNTPRPDSMNKAWAYIRGARLNQTYDNYTYVITPSIKNFTSRKMAAWITSRCNSTSRREMKVAALSKYMDIDVYGSEECAKKRCDVPKFKALTGIDCRIQIYKKYKFYFAFENSLCRDYVTEKFFDTLTTEMIPVVYGGSDYQAMFPAKSFINLMDFKKLQDLAAYMKYLSENPKEWLKYFEWRKTFWVQTNRYVTGYCDVCNKLWSNSTQIRQSYKSVADWWQFGNSEEPVCTLSSNGSVVGT